MSLSKLTSKLKHAPNTNSLVLANKGPQPRQFATMKCSSRVEPELKAAGSLSNSLNCPAITYISIMTVFTSLVIMNTGLPAPILDLSDNNESGTEAVKISEKIFGVGSH